MCGYKDTLCDAYKYLTLNQKFRKVWVEMVPNEHHYKLKTYMIDTLPTQMLDVVSHLPVVGNQKMRENVTTLKKINSRLEGMSDTFTFFIKGNWLYENKQIYEVINKMSPEERVEFNADCREMRWPKFLQNYAEGLAIWVLKEDKVAPIHGL